MRNLTLLTEGSHAEGCDELADQQRGSKCASRRSNAGALRGLLKMAKECTVSPKFMCAADEVEELCCSAADADAVHDDEGDGCEDESRNGAAAALKKVMMSRVKRDESLTVATWNPCGMSEERYDYIRSMGYDVVGLSELHGQHTKWESSTFICGGAVLDSDPAAGVAIMLSQRASDAVLAFGAVGSRLVWVRLAGLYHNILIVCCYIPHAGRTQPSLDEGMQLLDDTITDLAKNGDCVIVVGDFNCRLSRKLDNLTGKWCVHSVADAGGSRLCELMASHELRAASTFFQPRQWTRGSGVAGGNSTYIVAKEHGSTQAPAQLDYILISKRWMSGVAESKARWQPSYHRFGFQYDHALVSIKWSLRLRAPMVRLTVPDWQALRSDKAVASTFDEVVGEQGLPQDPSLEEEYMHLCESVLKAAESIPHRQKTPGKRRTASERTRQLFEEREAMCRALTKQGERGGQEWMAVHKLFKSAIRDSCRQDYVDFVESIATEVKLADERKDSRGVSRAVSKLVQLGRRPPQKSPCKKENGDLFSGPEELATAWGKFAQAKFQATERETERGTMPDLGPASARSADIPSDIDLQKCLKAMKHSKAPGLDQVPIEAYQASEVARCRLFALVKRIWLEEDVPEDMVLGVFVTLYKNKGSVDDMSQYRFICLLSHAYKLLAAYLLLRLLRDVEGYLPESQAGFRADYGTTDDIFALAVLMDHAIDEGSLLVSTFIDYVAAFDSVSHHFLDEAMAEAGGSDKCRSVFRAIYQKAAAVVRVRTSGGEEALSHRFGVWRGVLQGDVLSPLCFVLALRRVMILHDIPSGISLGSWLIDALEYADDQALLNTDVQQASARASSLQAGAFASADMSVSVPKTEVMLFQRYEDESLELSPAEIKRLLETGKSLFSCSLGCGAFFDSEKGRRTHERQCNAGNREIYVDEFVPERVIDVRGKPDNRFFRVKWEGWSSDPEDLTWEPAHHLEKHTELLDRFWSGCTECDRETGTKEVAGEHRCEWCCKLWPSHRSLCSHRAACPERRVKWKVRKRAVKTAVRVKRAGEQSQLNQVQMGVEKLKNVFNFTYLGHRFQADGDAGQAVEVRMAKAKSRFGKMHEVWRSPILPLKVKLLLYQHAVVSLLVHGHEAWDLTPELQTKLNGWNARSVAIITGRSIQEEAGRRGQTFDLVSHIRVRRLKWVGHVLRMEDPRFVKQALKVVFEKKQSGDLHRRGSVLMDVPKCSSFSELVALAGAHLDHPEWSAVVRELRGRVTRDAS